MRNFYFIIIGGTAVYLLVQLVFYLYNGRIFFRNTGILFEHTKNRLEWQMIFPKNLLLLVVFLFTSSLFGLLLDLAGVIGWLSLPCGAAGGLAVNFAINAAIVPFFFKLREKGLPDDVLLDGAEGIVREDIYPGDYGKIEVTNGGRAYIFDAVCANEKRILEGERVIVIYAQEGLCFVESETRFCDVLFENEPRENVDTSDLKPTNDREEP